MIKTTRQVHAADEVTALRDVSEVAARLGVSTKTVRRAIGRGDLPAHRLGRLLRISDADLAAYLSGRRFVSGLGGF